MLIRSLAELDRIRDECKSMVTKRSAVSAGAAAVPIPGLDIGTDVALLVEMLPAINSKFGLTPQQIEQLDTRSKRLIVVAASGIGSEIIGKFVSRTLVMSLLRSAAPWRHWPPPVMLATISTKASWASTIRPRRPGSGRLMWRAPPPWLCAPTRGGHCKR